MAVHHSPDPDVNSFPQRQEEVDRSFYPIAVDVVYCPPTSFPSARSTHTPAPVPWIKALPDGCRVTKHLGLLIFRPRERSLGDLLASSRFCCRQRFEWCRRMKVLHNERCAAWEEKVRSVENVTARKWISVGGMGAFGGWGGWLLTVMNTILFFLFFFLLLFFLVLGQCRKKDGKNEEVINCWGIIFRYGRKIFNKNDC